MQKNWTATEFSANASLICEVLPDEKVDSWLAGGDHASVSPSPPRLLVAEVERHRQVVIELGSKEIPACFASSGRMVRSATPHLSTVSHCPQLRLASERPPAQVAQPSRLLVRRWAVGSDLRSQLNLSGVIQLSGEADALPEPEWLRSCLRTSHSPQPTSPSQLKECSS